MEPYIKKISEVAELANQGMPLGGIQLQHASCTPGCGSIVDVLLMIPESAVLFISPPACGRHVTVYPNQRTGRVFTCMLEEKDLVVGTQTELLDEAIQNILERMNPKPKYISVCGSCVDKLLGTDYEAECKYLSKKYNMPINMTWMDPVIGHGAHPAARLYPAIFGSIEPSKDKPRKKIINVFGRLTPYAETSELYKVLGEHGYEVRHLLQCETLEDFYEMGQASANIIGHPAAMPAAEFMMEVHGVPFVIGFATLDPDIVSGMYRQLEQILGITINDSKYFEESKALLAKAKEVVGNKTIAVGETNVSNWNAFHNAMNLVKYGFNAKYVISMNLIPMQVNEINWLAANKPDLEVINSANPGMFPVIQNPLPVDFAIGTWEDWYYHRPETKQIDFLDNPQLCDYDSIVRLMNALME